MCVPLFYHHETILYTFYVGIFVHLFDESMVIFSIECYFCEIKCTAVVLTSQRMEGVTVVLYRIFYTG